MRASFTARATGILIAQLYLGRNWKGESIDKILKENPSFSRVRKSKGQRDGVHPKETVGRTGGTTTE